MNEIEITKKEYDQIYKLGLDCILPAICLNGMTSYFDEGSWRGGLQEILGNRMPAPFTTTVLKVAK